jgi:hypothetical protein
MNAITKSPYQERRGRPTIYADISRLSPGDCLHIPASSWEQANHMRISALSYAREHGIKVKTQIDKSVPEALIFCIKNNPIAK